jgi:hypothetical protein
VGAGLSDEYFELMLRNAWHMSGSTTRLRVLATFADGAYYAVALPLLCLLLVQLTAGVTCTVLAATAVASAAVASAAVAIASGSSFATYSTSVITTCSKNTTAYASLAFLKSTLTPASHRI